MPNPWQPEDAADYLRGTTRDVAGITRAGTSGLGNLIALPITMYPSPYAQLVPVTSGSFVELWFGRASRIYPTLSIEGRSGADVGTTGELRVEVEGVQVGPTIAIADGSNTTWSILNQPWPDGAFITTYMSVVARRLTGAGTVYVGIRYARAEPTTS